ncbi:MAG: VOC family protein [Candidatus Methylomirabilales bacterium]
MLGSSKLIAFVGTTDSQKARHFYENVLGLSFVANEPFALVFYANAVMIRIFKMEALTPAPYTVLGWSVADIVNMVQALRSKGVAFERFPSLEQDETGVWVSPSGAKVAWFKDPDGNVLSLTEFA